MGYWVAYARNPHGRKHDRPYVPFVEAAAPTEAAALRELVRVQLTGPAAEA
jgi:hypothetical protein